MNRPGPRRWAVIAPHNIAVRHRYPAPQCQQPVFALDYFSTPAGPPLVITYYILMLDRRFMPTSDSMACPGVGWDDGPLTPGSARRSARLRETADLPISYQEISPDGHSTTPRLLWRQNGANGVTGRRCEEMEEDKTLCAVARTVLSATIIFGTAAGQRQAKLGSRGGISERERVRRPHSSPMQRGGATD